MTTYDNDAFREYTDQQEDTVEIALDLSAAIPQAARALYEASDDADAPYESLDESDHEAYEAAVSVVLEAALPSISEQIVQAVLDDADAD